MKKRSEHCFYAQLNPNGRCIAYCHYNQGPVCKDCKGNTGKTIDPSRNNFDDQKVEIKI
jgi:hypothetical protein